MPSLMRYIGNTLNNSVSVYLGFSLVFLAAVVLMVAVLMVLVVMVAAVLALL